MIDKLQLKARVSVKGVPILLISGGLTGWKSRESFIDTFYGMIALKNDLRSG